jgi:hypothetical protein
MFAATEVSGFVTEQTVRMLEEEFDLVEQTLCRSQTGMILPPPPSPHNLYISTC